MEKLIDKVKVDLHKVMRELYKKDKEIYKDLVQAIFISCSGYTYYKSTNDIMDRLRDIDECLANRCTHAWRNYFQLHAEHFGVTNQLKEPRKGEYE